MAASPSRWTIVRLLGRFERVFIVDETATVQECGDNFNDGLGVVVNISLYFDDLALVGVCGRDNMGLRFADVSSFNKSSSMTKEKIDFMIAFKQDISFVTMRRKERDKPTAP
jgi:hypothetical protein